jgi:stage II sporulation protein D
MKRQIYTGLLAALTAVILPLLVCGMGEKTAQADSPEPSQESSQERQIREFVVHQRGESAQEETLGTDEALSVTVLVDGEPRDMTLGDYLTGVLLGEMPASFELEALKAQAVAARTYTLRRLEQGDELSDDPSVCQAYVDPENAQEKLGKDWESLLSGLRQAVQETDGQVLTYEGELISATYFSSAGGRTESAQAVWGGEVPYLVSVESPEEPSSSTVTVERETFLEALGITDIGVSAVTYTEGGGVDTMVIGGKTVSGTELRKLFGLKSTQFTMELTEDTVEFLVQGNGHRVGLSQYGAQTLAQEGKTYVEILQWYYTGVEIAEYR